MRMTEYTYYIKKEPGSTVKTYVAKIAGSHPQYILNRYFEFPEMRRGRTGYSCAVYLINGLYEVSVIRYDKKTKERVSRHRWWIIAVDDEVYEFDFEQMNWQYALFTAYNIAVNCR